MTRFNTNCTKVTIPFQQGGMESLIVKDSNFQNELSVCSRKEKYYPYSERFFICTVVKETESSRVGSLSVKAFGCVHQPITLIDYDDVEEVLFLNDYICSVCYYWITSFNKADSRFEHFGLDWTCSNRILFHTGNMFAFLNFAGEVSVADIGRKKIEKRPEIPADIVPLETEGKYLSPSTGKVVTVHTKRWTNLVRCCMINSKLGCYPLPAEMQDEILFLIGSLNSKTVYNKLTGEFRRVNFKDKEFDGELFSVSH
jgi:hypothetical protein